MTRGFTASLLLHLGLLAWVFFGMGIKPPRLNTPADAVEVAMISKADLETRQKQGDVSSKIDEAASTSKPSPIIAEKEVPKPKAAEAAPPAAAATPPPEPEPAKPVEPVVATPPPPAPVVEAKPAAPPPPAEPKVDEIALALAAEDAARRKSEADAADAKSKADAAAAAAKARADAAAAKKLADAKKAADAKKLADAKAAKDVADAKKRADIIAAGIAGAADGPKPELLDKDPTKKVGGGAAPSTAPTKTAAKGPTAGTATGRDSVNTANEEALLRSMISQALRPCWRLPTAGGDSRSIPTVKLVWKMRPNGTVDGDPRVLQKENSPIGSLAADAAVRAVTTCVFAGLPPDKYGLWREIEWDFDPRRAQ